MTFYKQPPPEVKSVNAGRTRKQQIRLYSSAKFTERVHDLTKLKTTRNFPDVEVDATDRQTKYRQTKRLSGKCVPCSSMQTVGAHLVES